MDTTVNFQLLRLLNSLAGCGQERALDLEPELQPSSFVPWAAYLSPLFESSVFVGWLSLGHQPLKEGFWVGRGRGRRETSGHSPERWVEMSGPGQASPVSESCLGRSRKRGAPCTGSAWSFRIQMTPVGLPPLRVASPSIRTSVYAGWLAGWWEVDADSSPLRKGKMLCFVS